jgi:prepilin-type processing-associated H-X9-DG protein
MAKKKKSAKPLNKTSMKKTKGGHSGGMNVCLADGSVRFISSSVSSAEPPDPVLTQKQG